MKERFNHYNLELEEVLIGTPGSSKADTNIETILTQLRSRQIAKEQLETYETQQKAAEKEKTLREAEAVAKQQTTLTESDINIRIQENQGKAELMKAKQDAEKIQRLAEADKEARVGISKAIAAREQVNAFESMIMLLLSEKLTSLNGAEQFEESKEVQRIKEQILVQMQKAQGEAAPTKE